MGRSTAIGEWRVHVGAHKTATTHLQATLEAAAPRICAAGGAFLPLPEVRRLFAGFPYSPWGYRLARALPAARPLLLRGKVEALRAAMEARAVPGGPMAFSEEDLLGGAGCILEGELYPHPAKMHLVAELARGSPLTIFLTVRSLDGYLPSAYAEVLKGRRLSRMDLLDVAKTFAGRDLHWTRLVARLRRLVPQARFEVWNFDDYPGHWRELHRRLVGVPVDDLPDISPPKRTRTPSEAGIRAAEALDMPSGALRGDEVRRIFAADIDAGGGAKFDPFEVEDKARFRMLYAQDLREMERRFPGLLFSPSSTF